MKTLSRTLAGAGVTAVVLATVAFGVAPAGAHTGSLFTVLSPIEAPYTAATISPTDATTAALPTALSESPVVGLEIYNETGYALIQTEGEGGPEYAIATWDHNTGAQLSSVPLTAGAGAEIQDLGALDTTTDGTILAIAEIDILGEVTVTVDAVVSINPTTGALTIVVDISDFPSQYTDSLSTDPTTGVTYLWADDNDGVPQYSVLNFTGGGSYGPVINMPQITTDLGGVAEEYISGADFDTAGTLWFFYSSTFASLTGSPSATVGAVASGPQGGDVVDINLAYDPAPEPALAATGTPIVGILAGGLALIVAGVAVGFASRRRTA